MKRAMWAIVMSAAVTGAAPVDADAQIDRERGLTLPEAIARALEQEPGLRADRTAVPAARGELRQAALRPSPMLSFERRDEPGGMDSQTAVMVEWPLDLFGRPARITTAERELETAEHEVADRQRLLAAAVRLQYGEAAAAIRDLEVMSDLASALARQLEIVRARVEQGAAPRLERDLLDVELRRIHAARLLQAGRVEAALVELKRLLGQPPGEPLALAQPLEELVEADRTGGDAAGGGGESARQRADVRRAAAETRTAEARVDAALSAGRPDVSVFGGYMRMDAGFPQLAFGAGGDLERVRGRVHSIAGGLTIALPLWNRNQGGVAAARAGLEGAAARHAAAVLAAESEIAAARVRDEHARRAVGAYAADARRLARQNLDVVHQTYALGRATVFDVLAEERRYLDTEQALTSALREAFEARTALLRALGEVR